jgi:drug/metabolite transporter (DMT)-like permease
MWRPYSAIPGGVHHSLRLNALSLNLGAAGSVLAAFAVGRLGPFDAAWLGVASVLAAAYLSARLSGRPMRPGVDAALIGAGLLDGAGCVAYYAGLARLGPVPLALLGGLSPVLAAGLAYLALGERLGPAQVAAGAVAVAGALLFSWRDGAAASGPGLALAFAAMLAFAASNLLCKVALRRRSAEEVLVGSRRWSLLAILLAGLVAGRLGELPFDARGTALVVASALLGSWLAVRLFLEALRQASLSVAAVVRAAAPVATAAAAWPFFPVSLTPLNLAGGAVLLVSVAWLGRSGGGSAGPPRATSA